MILIEPTEKYSPSSLTAYERYEALIPILSEASEAYLRIYSEQKSDKRDAEINARLKALFDKVARNSAMSVEEAKRAFLGYTAKGIAGLMTPTPIDARKCVTDARGTWELAARYTNGGNSKHSRSGDFKTHARSSIYYEMVSPTEMKELVTMWNDENHYPRPEALAHHGLDKDDTFFIAALSDSKFRQVDEYTVEYLATSELVGNHGHYQTPVKGIARVVMMNIDGEATFMSVPETFGVLPNGAKVPVTGTFLLVNNRATADARSFTMSGLPPMAGDTRTMDVSDHYVKVSDQQPLIGGWEPIEAYYTRLRDVQSHLAQVKTKAPAGAAAVHGFYAANQDALKRYSVA
jgi:hypothetical protein